MWVVGCDAERAVDLKAVEEHAVLHPRQPPVQRWRPGHAVLRARAGRVRRGGRLLEGHREQPEVHHGPEDKWAAGGGRARAGGVQPTRGCKQIHL
jgi:hypothetical protein